MTSAFFRDLSIPVVNEKFRKVTGLETPPQVTLVDLAALKKMWFAKEIDPTMFLTVSEQQTFAAFSYPKRQMEWLGGRIAAKRAGIDLMRQQSAADYPDWQVVPDQHGRPFLKPVSANTASPIEISISHSGDCGVALAVFERPCGVDIQKKSSAAVRVREKFCCRREDELIKTLKNIRDEEMRFTLLWSAKEALRKALGGNPLTGFMEMVLERIECLTESCWAFSFLCNSAKDAVSCRVIGFLYRDYGCSVSFK